MPNSGLMIAFMKRNYRPNKVMNGFDLETNLPKWAKDETLVIRRLSTITLKKLTIYSPTPFNIILIIFFRAATATAPAAASAAVVERIDNEQVCVSLALALGMNVRRTLSISFEAHLYCSYNYHCFNDFCGFIVC